MRSQTMTRSQTSSSARLAILLGGMLRTLGVTLPGILGPLLVCAGLFLAWPPLGVIALGSVLWLIDWRIR